MGFIDFEIQKKIHSKKYYDGLIIERKMSQLPLCAVSITTDDLFTKHNETKQNNYANLIILLF